MWRLAIIQCEDVIEFWSEDKGTLLDIIRYLSDLSTKADTSYTLEYTNTEV